MDEFLGCLYISISWDQYVCQYVHMAVGMSVHQSVCLSVHSYSFTSLCVPRDIWGLIFILVRHQGVSTVICSYIQWLYLDLPLGYRAHQLALLLADILSFSICFILSQYAIMSLGFKKSLFITSCHLMVILSQHYRRKLLFSLCLSLQLLLPLLHLWQLCNAVLHLSL